MFKLWFSTKAKNQHGEFLFALRNYNYGSWSCCCPSLSPYTTPFLAALLLGLLLPFAMAVVCWLVSDEVAELVLGSGDPSIPGCVGSTLFFN